MSDSYIWPIDKTLSGASTLGQSGLRSNGHVGVLHIPQSSRLKYSLCFHKSDLSIVAFN